jgi:hypothetical protein
MTDDYSVEASFFYITLHFRLFAILQQLHIMPSSRIFPSWQSFFPFTKSSPIQLPPAPSRNISSLASWASSALVTLAPILVILVHGKAKFFISRLLYRPIYKSLPRPTGDSMFSGIPDAAPSMEYDAPDRINVVEDIEIAPDPTFQGENAHSLQALEGQATESVPPPEIDSRPAFFDVGQESSEEEEMETAHATMISFDVEQTETQDNTVGTWSAELRSTNSPRRSKRKQYHVTGLTLLPTILATEALREVIAGILVMPLEALMARIIARAYRKSAGASVADLYTLFQPVPVAENLLSAFALQVVIAGTTWAGFTLVSHCVASIRYPGAEKKGGEKQELD